MDAGLEFDRSLPTVFDLWRGVGDSRAPGVADDICERSVAESLPGGDCWPRPAGRCSLCSSCGLKADMKDITLERAAISIWFGRFRGLKVVVCRVNKYG